MAQCLIHFFFDFSVELQIIHRNLCCISLCQVSCNSSVFNPLFLLSFVFAFCLVFLVSSILSFSLPRFCSFQLSCFPCDCQAFICNPVFSYLQFYFISPSFHVHCVQFNFPCLIIADCSCCVSHLFFPSPHYLLYVCILSSSFVASSLLAVCSLGPCFPKLCALLLSGFLRYQLRLKRDSYQKILILSNIF